MRRIVKVVVIVAVVAVFGAACGDDDDSSSSDSSSTTAGGGGGGGDLDSQLTTAQVQTLQEELTQVGCFDGSEDGIFGPVTRRGVEAFQAAEGLSEDGEYGPETTAALTQAASDGKTVCTTTPSTTPSTAPCTADAITAAVSGTPGFQTIHAFDCAQDYAMVQITVGTGGSATNPYVKLKSSGASWAETQDPCASFPSSLQSECELA